jgi:hypothetical protein
MQLSARHVSIVNTLYMMNLELAKGEEAQRRQLTQKIDEQICFEFGPRWGMKARAGGSIDTASKDSIGYLEDDGTVSTWDWQNGTSREPQIHEGEAPHYPHLPLSEAKFIAVQPVNHLSSVPDDGDGDTEDNPDLTQLIKGQAAILESIHLMMDNQVKIAQTLQVLLDKPVEVTIPPITFPEYEASTFFGKITLRPKK